MQPDQNAIQLDDLYSIEDLAAAYPLILTPDTLRWQLRDRKKNGLDHATLRIGKRLVISKSRYEQWIATRAGNA